MAKILIIEDDMTSVKLIMSALESTDYSIITAFNGEQGATLARNEMPDLIILDLIMPLGGGTTVLKNLKLLAHTKAIPVIVVSGTNDSDLIEETKRMGIEGFFAKPFDRVELVEKIKEVLAR